ncbi:MAG: DUF2490 domain-containing protein [Candidatus Saganbacteria bacterium]|nr:DUF2490 domain-containing protein [Candidatus Saganbacteria bacterium]
MLKRFLVPACVLMLGFGVALAETEFWTVDTVQMPIKAGVGFSVIPELRVRSNFSELYYMRLYLGPTFAVNNTLGVSLFYAPTESKSAATGNWSSANILVADAIFAWPQISDRSRLEYDPGTTLLKYRNRLQIKYDNWALAEEPFYNCQRGYVDENRCSLVYSFKLNDRLSLEPGFLLRSQRPTPGGDWTNTGVVLFNSTVKI